MLENGFIKLHRSLLKWEWYDDLVTKSVFIHLLLTVNIKDDRWHGITVPQGSRVVSIEMLSKELRLTNRQIRTALQHLESTGSVTRSKYPKFTVISVVRWMDYQENRQAKRHANDRQSDNQATSNRQQNKNIKNIEEDKEIRAHARDAAPAGLSDGELQALKRKMRE